MTKEIPLTAGKLAIVDDEDYEWLMQWKWHYSSGAAVRKSGILMHRVITGAPAGMQVDHKDRDKMNNTRANLRVCTSSENMRNRRSWGKSQYKGVGWNPASRKWQARIGINGKQLNCGFFEDEAEAAKARDAAARIYHGEFAELNFP